MCVYCWPTVYDAGPTANQRLGQRLVFARYDKGTCLTCYNHDNRLSLSHVNIPFFVILRVPNPSQRNKLNENDTVIISLNIFEFTFMTRHYVII